MANEIKYKNFEVADFLADEEFQSWVKHPNEKSNQFWDRLIATYPEKKEAVETAAELIAAISFKEAFPPDVLVETSLAKSLESLRAAEQKSEVTAKTHQKGQVIYKTWWAAAAVFLLLAFASYFFLRSGAQNQPVKNSTSLSQVETDIAPGGTKAVLTLSNGKQIYLDEAGSGVLAKQGTTKINKTAEGAVKYDASAVENGETISYNTVATPRGGQYQLILADGTKVWLNAASSLRFPTAFAGGQRTVELTGEAYFEVAPNKEKAFRVQLTGGIQVQVLGTHFNVNSYTDEEATQTTLLEGLVQVSNGSTKILVKPGQQASVSGDNFQLIKSVNLDEVMAWKNGYFSFQNANLQTIMRQISRWYDVDVVYQGVVPQVKFSGEVGRSLNLSQVLSALTEMGIKYKIEGKKITIMS